MVLAGNDMFWGRVIARNSYVIPGNEKEGWVSLSTTILENPQNKKPTCLLETYGSEPLYPV